MEATIQWLHEQQHHCLGQRTSPWHYDQQHPSLWKPQYSGPMSSGITAWEGTSPWHRDQQRPSLWRPRCGGTVSSSINAWDGGRLRGTVSGGIPAHGAISAAAFAVCRCCLGYIIRNCLSWWWWTTLTRLVCVVLPH